MSLSTGFVWNHKNVRLVGYSIGGSATCITFPEADVAFDVAQGLPFALPISNLLITHGHLDHASGIPYLISQKAMMGITPPTIYMPDILLRPMREIMRLWEHIDQHTYQYQFHSVKPGDQLALKAPFFFRPFPTFHRVPSHGYTIFEKKKRLKEEYRQLAPMELGNLRRQGLTLEDHYDEAVISFTGDTTIECLDSPQVQESRILLIEVTYWDEQKSVENARTWGHIHLFELLPKLEKLKCEKIVLIHASARYTSAYLREIIDARVPEHFKHRVELFPRPI